MTECSIEGCVGAAIKRGWCSKHYQRWRKKGDVHYDPAVYLASKIPGRFWSNVEKGGGDCWEWSGLTNDSGYGLMGVGRKHVRAHRLSWELHHGPIPEGMQVDHICRNRGCVNPTHLRLATPKENSEHTDSRPGSLSKYRGVSFDKRRGKWVAQVHHQSKNYFGGSFDDEDAAGIAARDLRNHLHTHNALDRQTT